ncbi:MAG TPA: glycosyltransferase family 39 protein [Candidatus Polarisedimenticolia bacterium]|nr:glycosyltransferase family 39 protein [Candidatus Polarisedimenticolia bacterium]
MTSPAVRIFRSDHNCLLLLIPLTLLLVGLDLGGRDLWEPDETRTGEVVREIVSSGSWAVLHDNGQPYLEKPPLYFWLAAAVSRAAGGVSELTVRLPASLAALLGVVSLFYLGRDLFGRRVGALAGLILATSWKYFMEARWGRPDMLWTLFLTFACLAFHRAYRAGGARGWLLGFYLAMGLAILTKGPAGLVLPLLAAGLFLVAIRDPGFLRRAGLAWGLPVAALPAALWLAAYRATSGEAFPMVHALGRLATRFTEGVHHAHSFAHTLTSLAIDFMPWVLFLPGAAWLTAPWRGARSDHENAYLYSWIAVIFCLFALSVEKRGIYLLPLLPFLALLLARFWDLALMGWQPSPVERPIAWALGAGTILTGATATYVLGRARHQAADLLFPGALLAAAVLLTLVVTLAAHRRLGGGPAFSAFASGLVACYLVVIVQVLPALDRHKSARPFAARIVSAIGAAPLGIYPDYRAAYAYYTGRLLRVVPDREALQEFLRSAPVSYCLMEEDVYEVERRMLGTDLQVVDRDTVGHRVMILVAGGRGTAPPAAGDEGGVP